MNKKSKKVSKNEALSGELGVGEPHPSAFGARDYLVMLGINRLLPYLASYSSCALAGNNRLAEVCGETLDRFLKGKPVSDRYMLGLAWNIKNLEEMHANKKQNAKAPRKNTKKNVQGSKGRLRKNKLSKR